MQEPAVSVIIPVYNTEAYVKECVDSVLAQTFQDFEIILVDDCSTDGSLALCRELYGNLPQVRILAREKNGTVGAARNTGMKAARGKYIAFLDSDDLYMPNALECLYQRAEEYGADVVHSPGCYLPNRDMEHITVEDEFRRMIFDGLPMVTKPELLREDKSARVLLWAQRKLFGTIWNKLFCRSFLEHHQVFFEENIVPGQDAIFMFRCVLYGERYLRIPDIFYIYRRPAASATRRNRDADFLAALIGCMVDKVRALDRYMDEDAFFLDRPKLREAVRQFVIRDTDPFFVQECYGENGRVDGDHGQVEDALERYFGKDAWLMGYYFHAYHMERKNIPKNAGLQMNYVFPWQLVREGSRVVIYGAGEVGKCFYEQAARFSYVELAGIVDRNAGSIHTLGIPVQKVEALSGMEFDHILISVINRNLAADIRRDLISMGIGEEKILWDGETYSIDDHYRKVWFPLLRSGKIVVYGAGLNAQEYYRYLERQGKGREVLCFAVTRKEGHPDTLCGKPLCSIGEAVERYPGASIHVALQEKYHGEVRETLRGLGREAETYIGLREMTRLLGEAALEELSGAFPEFAIERKPKDYSMIYLYPKEAPWKIYEFYPMTQVPLSEEDLRNLKRAVEKEQDELFGSYPDEPNLRKSSRGEPSLFLAMAFSGKDALLSEKRSLPAYLHPVRAGAASFRGPREEGVFYDDAGENISEKNALYSELTVTYWLWKNMPQEDYLGICHYRRHFLLTEGLLEAMKAKAVDLILPRPRLTFPDVKGFLTSSASSMEMEDYRRTLDILRGQNPGTAELATRIGDGQLHFPNNMLIARREIFGEYCRWMFRMLDELEERYRREGIRCAPRSMGYIGELLTTVFIARKHEACRLVYADYELLE